MSDNFDDCEFWLPPQFLTDDDLLMDFKASSVGGEGKEMNKNEFSYGFNPFGSQSDLGSPVESVVGGSTTETESDEEDYITGLTLKMAHSTLQDNGFGYENTKAWNLSGSPQSTLCGCKQGSSRGSPNCASQVSSPPRMDRNEVNMDLLYAAAGEVARIRMMEEVAGQYQQNKADIWGLPRKTSPAPIAPKNTKPVLGPFSTNQPPPLTYHQLQLAQFQRLKQQQIMNLSSINQNQQQLAQNRARNGGMRPLNLPSSAWPTLQQSQEQQQHQQPGSGMRAVFLGNPGPKRECAGTGVFLPRKIGTQTESRRKPAPTTVLLPDRVVQALNLNLEAMDVRAQPQVQNRCFTPVNDGNLNFRNNNNVLAAQQRRNSRTQPASIAQDFQLPQEWTY